MIDVVCGEACPGLVELAEKPMSANQRRELRVPHCPNEEDFAMRASVFAAAVLVGFAVPALAQTTPGTTPPSGATESGAGKPGEHPPTGRVDQNVPTMKSDQPPSGA